jgi:transposase
MVNWQHAFLDLPDTKGGQLKIPVSSHVLGLLKHIHDQTGNPRTGYVLRGPKGTRIKSINRTWENVRAAAGIPDVRLHDLRHSFASDALMCGVPLAVVGAMLGHKHDRTTQRYAHLANDVVRDGLEAATDRIVGATRAVVMLEPPPFERLTDREWKRIAAIVEATRGTCGGTRTDLRRAVDAVRWVLHNGAKWREMPKDLGRHDVLAVVRALVRRWDVGEGSRPPWSCRRSRSAASRATCRGAGARQADDRGRGDRGRAVHRAPGPPGGAPPVRLTPRVRRLRSVPQRPRRCRPRSALRAAAGSSRRRRAARPVAALQPAGRR